jgi:hypothetical protein
MRLSLLILAVPLLTTIGLRAQPGTTRPAGAHPGAAPKAPDPTFLNQVYYYWSDSLLPCPKTEGRMESKMKALGFGGSQMGYTMDGGRSALRIRTGDSLRFIIKMASMMGDPSTLIQLYRFDAKKDSRQAITSNQSRFGGNKGSKVQVSFDVQKSGADVFILIPSTRLAPGEYGFMNTMAMNQSSMASVSYTFYTFGVDP